ncbi:flagellin [Anaerotignum sp.]|uniref:flagellin N-terminal helical domain-containing protein n=1 Tax=Anaerotignum sp. TaxID=2039241 RepID=UPI003332AE72
MRITTNQVLRNYQSNLSKSSVELDNARNRVLTKRNFNKTSENPAAAAKAYKLRKEYADNENYLENVKNVISHFDAVESSTLQMSEITKQANALILEGITSTASIEQRKTLATSLRNMQESLVLSANSKLGETFLFGGQTTDSVPFELVDGKLQYFGLDVSSTDPDVQAKLKKMAGEEILVDLGFGMSFSGGNVTANSAFNTAFSGLTPLGFGNKDGVDQNIVNLLGDIATELEKDTVDDDTMNALTKQFDKARNNLTDFVTVLGTKNNFLEATSNRLDDNRITLNEKIVSLENVDLSEAITEYSWAQFAYNAALKVGNSILSQSFIDFMN